MRTDHDTIKMVLVQCEAGIKIKSLKKHQNWTNSCDHHRNHECFGTLILHACHMDLQPFINYYRMKIRRLKAELLDFHSVNTYGNVKTQGLPQVIFCMDEIFMNITNSILITSQIRTGPLFPICWYTCHSFTLVECCWRKVNLLIWNGRQFQLQCSKYNTRWQVLFYATQD